MYKEFLIAKDLEHPSIIQYYYFIKEYDEKSKTHLIQNIIEFIDGKDLNSYFIDEGKSLDLP